MTLFLAIWGSFVGTIALGFSLWTFVSDLIQRKRPLSLLIAEPWVIHKAKDYIYFETSIALVNNSTVSKTVTLLNYEVDPCTFSIEEPSLTTDVDTDLYILELPDSENDYRVGRDHHSSLPIDIPALGSTWVSTLLKVTSSDGWDTFLLTCIAIDIQNNQLATISKFITPDSMGIVSA